MIRTVTITIPVGEIPPANYVPKKLETRLDPKQRRALMQITKGLDASQATTENGQRVTGNPDTIRWLVEQVAAALNTANPA